MKTRGQRFSARLCRGISLLELVVALTIIAMLSGTVYAIISGSVRAAVHMQHVQIENDEVNRFIQVLRQAFQSLPSTATITLKTGDTSSGLQELTISGSPECFGFGPNPISYKDTIIGLRPDENATEKSESKQTLFFLGITREDIIPQDPSGQSSQQVRSTGAGLLAPDGAGRIWMPLMSNVASLTWRCYKDDQEQWQDEWSSTAFPQLVEMNLTLAERTQAIRVVFATPAMKLAGANAALAVKTKAATPTAGSAAASDAGGGGGGPGGRGGKGGKGGPGGGKGGPGGGRGAAPGGKGGGGPNGQQAPSQPAPRVGGFAPAGNAAPAAGSGGKK